jgi:hypothetical protein
MTAIATTTPTIEGLEQVLISGDLSALSPDQAVAYYARVCESVGLNPLTQPFEYLKLNGRMILYARRAATEQLRRIHRVSIAIASREVVEGCYVVTARATTPDGRTDENIGAVPVHGLKGENLANALMKAETKAKRRVTLAICGLSFLDESELEGVRGAERVPMPQAAPQLAEVVPIQAGMESASDATPPERQTIAEMFGTKLRQQKTKAEMVAWMREVIAAEFEESIRKTLWRMFRHQCVSLGFDANLLARAAQSEVTHG